MHFLLVFCLSPAILLKHYSNIVITINRWKIQNTKMKLYSHIVFSSSSSPLLNNTAKWYQFETNCFKNNFHYAKYFDTKKKKEQLLQNLIHSSTKLSSFWIFHL